MPVDEWAQALGIWVYLFVWEEEVSQGSASKSIFSVLQLPWF